MASMRKLSSFPVHFAVVGGSMMYDQGLKISVPNGRYCSNGDLGVVAAFEQGKLKETAQAALLFRPHVVVTVDSKGFSFRLLKQLRGGEARLKGLSEFVDHVLCILPFEAEVCRLNGLAATFVGHPILEDVLELNLGKNNVEKGWKVHGSSDKFQSKHEISSGATIISLLPGSRLHEVNRMLPVFFSAMKLLKDCFSELIMVIHVAPTKHVEDYINRVVHKCPIPVILIPGGSPHMKYDGLTASQVALCISGTVAVEMQLARLPCVVAYRAHVLTEWDLIQNEAHREEQIVAAEKVIELLRPSERSICNPSAEELEPMLSNHTPSMI
ncbi:hypothetical protein RHSIM_Rhsim04G0049100 [Rhododendron simsii]|uniref:lipid-A-disaccharide synthase n=1 Tax=Rhododendron simsii TaxID=118357 RepID=A0A834H280_RHOSS|nr:hypothetical protein RHSIM_Rhsim04G0049100 [Rhododendron simsii]